MLIKEERAFDLYKVAAKEGSNSARKGLVYLYEQGEGTEKNLGKAIYWYKKAAGDGYQEVK